MMRNTTIGLLLAGLLFTTACLLGKTTHTIYLDPGGEVTWTVLEEAVRSAESEPADRVPEEREYLDQARNGVQPVARALDWLGPEELQVDVLRQERPFTVRTQARFRAADRLGERFLEGLGAAASVRLEHEGDRARLTITLSADDRESDSDGSPLEALIADPTDYRILLVRGRFLEATGFNLSDDGGEAIPRDDACDDPDVCTLSLTWTVPE